MGGSAIAIGSEIGEIRLYEQRSTGCRACDPSLHYPGANGPFPTSGDVDWWLGRVLWPVSGAWLSQTVPRSVKRLAKNRASFSEDDLCGVLAIRHGLCWGNENRGDTLIAPWRGSHKVPECWATCELRFDHRQRKQHPRSSCTATINAPSRRSHRELPENISHAIPRRGPSVGTGEGVCVRCGAWLLRDQIAAQP